MTVSPAASGSVAGIVTDSVSNARKVPTTLRSDGTERKERKIRPGFTPLEDVGRFRSPRVAERAAREGSPQLGAGLAGRSLESWANDALKDQAIQQSPLRTQHGGRPSFNPAQARPPPSFRAPPAQTAFPSLASLEHALPAATVAQTEQPPHLAAAKPTDGSAGSPPPRRPWPTRAPPTASSSSNTAINPTPITSTHFPTATSPPGHSHRSLASDVLDAMPSPSPAAYSKTRRLQSATNPSMQTEPHNVQSDWNAAKHCFTSPPRRNGSQPKPQRRPSATSSTNGEAMGPVASSASASPTSSAPPSAYNSNGRRPKGHGRSVSSSSSTKSNKSSASGSVARPAPPAHPIPSAAISISPVNPPPSTVLAPSLAASPAKPAQVVVNLPRSRLAKPESTVAPTSTSTYNNKPAPTGPRNPTAPQPAVVPKREGGSWGAAKSMHAPKPPAPSAHAPPATNTRPVPLHLTPAPTLAPPISLSAPTLPPAIIPPAQPKPDVLPLAPLVPAAPPPAVAVARPPRAKTEGGTWGLKAKSAFAPATTPKAEEAHVQVAVKLPPSEDKLLAPPAAQAPPSPKKKTRGERAKGSAQSGAAPKPSAGGMGISIKGAAAAKREGEERQRVVDEERTASAVPAVVVVVNDVTEPEEDQSVQEAVVADDLVNWAAPLSGRSWADDDDDLSF